VLGAIAGDVIGSIYEFAPIKRKEFPLFPSAPMRMFATDDSILTVAVAGCLLHGRPYVPAFHEAVLAYPRAGWARDTEAEVLAEAERSAAVTHDHPEGIKGAQATALAVFLARTGHDKPSIREAIASRFGYDLSRSVDAIRPHYRFDVSCQGTVPEALICFLDGTDFEDAVRNAVSLGGDADTLACITGAVAEAFWGGVPDHIAEGAMAALPVGLRVVVGEFRGRWVEG
jgi:ADP-ribosylglycohydrolase